MTITHDHWTVFRLIEQEGYSLFQASEKMGIDRQGISKLLDELKGIAPELFPIESEKANLRRQLRDIPVEQQPDMLEYEPSMENSIKEKY